MKCIFILFLGMASLAGAQMSHIQLRVVTFQKAGAATSLEAAAPNSDESLYAALAAEAGTGGKVRRVYDQTLIIRSGQRSKVEAFRDYGYPSQNDPEPAEWMTYPVAMTSRPVGQSLEAEATAGEEDEEGGTQRLLDINLAPELLTLPALHPWPVPDFRAGGRMGQVLRPVFGNHKLTTQVMTWTGRTVLISVAPAPEAAFSEGAAPEFCYTFLRAGLNGEKPAAPGKVKSTGFVTQRRLHFLSVRLPRNEAAALLLRHAGDDAALYAALGQQVNAGTAALTGHTSMLCRQGQRSKVESKANFEVPGNYVDMIPESWMGCDPGAELEVEAESITGEDGEDPAGLWNVAYFAREAPELVPYYPSAKHPALHGAAPEYVERKVTSQMRIPESGVLCSTVLSTTGPTEEEGAPGGLTDVSFAVQSPPPGKAGKSPTRHILLQAAVLSVPATEGPALAAGARTKAAAERLLARLQTGEITCAAHAGVTIRAGQRSNGQCLRSVQQPGTSGPAAAAPEVSVPESWDSTNCGVELQVDYAASEKGNSVSGYLEWDAAPVVGFGEPGAEVPEMEKRRCGERVRFDDLLLKSGEPVIVDARASRAREGTTEYGRWHVMVVVAR